MNFATYIRPWLDEMRAQKETIIRRGAIDKLTSLLAEQRAHKTPVLPIPLTFDRAAFDALAAAGRLIASAQTKIVRQLMRDHTRVELLRRSRCLGGSRPAPIARFNPCVFARDARRSARKPSLPSAFRTAMP